MHEFSLMDAVIKRALEINTENGGGRIVRITLSVGAYCQVVPDSLELAFQVLSAGTDAEGAELRCLPVDAVIECEACGHVFQPGGVFWQCPRCEERAGRVLEGNDLLLESVELADACEEKGSLREN